MKMIYIELRHGEQHGVDAGPKASLALPVRVAYGDGSLIAENVVSSAYPLALSLFESDDLRKGESPSSGEPFRVDKRSLLDATDRWEDSHGQKVDGTLWRDPDAPVFVSLVGPSGNNVMRAVNWQPKRGEVARPPPNFGESEETHRPRSYDECRVVFESTELSQQEPSGRAVHRGANAAALASADTFAGKHQFNKALPEGVWLAQWRLEQSHWVSGAVQAHSVRHAASAVQFQVDLELNGDKCLLQVGGPETAWRFVALPGVHTCRVLLTPNASMDPRAEPLKVTVSSERADAEALMVFLARDALSAAVRLSRYSPLNAAFWQQTDPVAAAAMGYFYLRCSAPIHSNAFTRLAGTFPHVADFALQCCINLIRTGLRDESHLNQARRLFHECWRQGLPWFSEGMSLLYEAASVLREGDEELYRQVELLMASRAWAGPALSFYGENPYHPHPGRIHGTPVQTIGTSVLSSGPSRLRVPKGIDAAFGMNYVMLDDLQDSSRGAASVF
jgi:hypothetical protein